jgi:peptide/nickel transport system permease protein
MRIALPRGTVRLAAAIAAIAALACLGPVVAPMDPLEQDLMRVMEPPGARHWLGTDHVGRDVLSRVLAGAPYSLGLAMLSVGMSASSGTLLGLVAANSGATGRAVVMRLADLVLAFPGLLLALLLSGLFGGGILPMLAGLHLAMWPQYARMADAAATSILREGHVEAARLAGFPEWIILLRHVLPRVLRTLAPLAILGTGQAIMSIAALGFLGLGLRPPTPEWGAMINELLPFLAEGIVQVAAPCAAIFATVLALSLAGRSLAGSTMPPSVR